MSLRSVIDDLRRIASQNDFFVKGERKVASLLEAAEGTHECQIVNVYKSNGEKGYLILTATGAHKVTPGTLSLGTIESLPYADIDGITMQQGTFSRCLYRDLTLRSPVVSLSFRFLWLCPTPGMELMDRQTIEIAEHNMRVAADEIEGARSGSSKVGDHAGRKGRQDDSPTIRPRVTLYGQRQDQPEGPDRWPRRQRLFEFAQQKLEGHPLTSSRAFGRPLGDAYGMEELVGIIAPVFVQERSLIRWVAIRGALASLWQCGPPTWEAFSNAVGLRHVQDSFSEEGRWIVANRPDDFDESLDSNVLGLHASIMMKVTQYDEIQGWSVERVNKEVFVNESMGLDYIAWASTVLLRLEARNMLPPTVSVPPPPSALEQPGWYIDPVFGKCDRYWNGSDWTSSCRVMKDGRYREYEVALS